MSLIHIRATAKGSGRYEINPAPSSTQNVWKLKQVLMHCAATFTAASSFQVTVNNHEATAYDCVLLNSALATVNGLLNDIVWLPDQPICLVGKDRIVLEFAGASATLPWAYDVAIEV